MITPEPYELPGAAPEPGAADQASGPPARGALTIAAMATAIVIAIWLLFYLFVFLPRATVL